jgi:Fur family transcriptional regulator, peroxide stress response regulator
MHHSTNRATLLKELTAHGLKATHQRIVVYEALLELHDKHPVAEDVYQHLQQNNPTISLGTVYKTLDTLSENGLIKRVLSEKGSNRYDADNTTHNHIYCSNTKEIIDYRDEELDELLHTFFKKRNMENFEIKNFFLQLTGNKIDPNKQVRITHTDNK